MAEAQAAPARGALGEAAPRRGFSPSERTVCRGRGALPRLRGKGRDMSLISVENLSIRYGGQTALAHVDLAIEPGEIVTIVGPQRIGQDQPVCARSSAP